VDRIFDAWLNRQQEDAEAFAAQTDLVRLAPFDPERPSQRYIAEFGCRGLVRTSDGAVEEADRFVVGLYFPPDYLRRLDPWTVVTLFEPLSVWHPNVRLTGICVGRVRPGTGLIDLVDQVHQILTFQNMRIDDPLNPEAAAWARDHLDRFPVDRRPLRRRSLAFRIEAVPPV
jgi:hypothetical protein